MRGNHPLWAELAWRLRTVSCSECSLSLKLGDRDLTALRDRLMEARVRVEIHNAARNPYADLGQLIHWMADREDLPHLFAAFAEESAEAGPDGFGIELILDGIAARVRQKQRDRKL